MSFGVEPVDQEKRVSEKLWFPGHAIGAKRAGKIVDHALWWFVPSSDQGGKHVIAAFTVRDAVETVAHAVCAPGTHDATCQTFFSVFREELGAPATMFATCIPFLIMG